MSHADDGGWSACWTEEEIRANLETAQMECNYRDVGILYKQYIAHLDVCPVCKGKTSQYAELFRKCPNPPVGIGRYVRAE